MPDDPAPRWMLTSLGILFGELGVPDRPDRLWLCSDHAGRRLTSSSELTRAEAEALIGRLEKLRLGDLQRVLASRPAPRAIVCNRGRRPPTERDLEVVAEFGEFLEQQQRRDR